MDNKTIRVRIAPSPTGKFHLGTARTALFNYLFAKKHGGKFIVRIEDTDAERSQDAYADDILDCLHWLGMQWDEGPLVGGEAGPYFQKERLSLYQPFIAQLLVEDKAYKCFCTKEELDAERNAQQKAGKAPKYSGKCRNLTTDQVAELEKRGKPFVIRFKTPEKTVVLDDLIRGEVEFDAGLFGDFPIVRTDGTALFVLTNTIDDKLMDITHVLRAEEHLSNAAKQVLLAEALGFKNPQFGHFPLILNSDRSKMSKRKNPVSVTDDYRAKGYLSEALVNFLALLGWSSGTDQEVFSMRELINEFQIERVGKSAAIFDKEKLLWMNGYYLRHLDLGDLAERCKAFISSEQVLEKINSEPAFYLQAVSLIQERIKTLDEAEDLLSFFFVTPQYESDLLVARRSDRERTETALSAAKTALEQLDAFELDAIETALRSAAQENDLKDGELLWAVRVALSGKSASPGTFELVEVFGKQESLKRIEAALSYLK